MATKLFLRNTTTNGVVSAGNVYYDMLTTAGSAVDSDVVTSVASGTEIQWTQSAGGSAIQWISGYTPTAGFTLTTTDISVWCLESGIAVNAGGRYRVFKRSFAGVETELGGGPFDDGVEFSTLSTEMVWTGDVTDTEFVENDRLVVKLYITNAGGGPMGGGTCTAQFNAANGATGDSFFNIAETVSFLSTPVVAANSGAGRSRRKRRYTRLLVRINGKIEEVESVEELLAMLKEVRKEVKVVAEEKAKEIIKVGKKVGVVKHEEPKSIELVKAPDFAKQMIEERIKEVEIAYWESVERAMDRLYREEEEEELLLNG